VDEYNLPLDWAYRLTKSTKSEFSTKVQGTLSRLYSGVFKGFDDLRLGLITGITTQIISEGALSALTVIE